MSTIWPATWAGDHLTRRQGMERWGVVMSGTGRALPGDPLTNEDLLERYPLDTTADWIRDHTGIASRHHADVSLATSDIAAEASLQAIADAGIEPTDVGRIILGTTTGDWTSPAAANRVQQLIGAQCPAIDVQTACSSWIFALEQGARLVATGVRNVLVVGADVKSRFVRRTDHRLFPVLADGAGAAVLDVAPPDSDDGILQLELYSDGSMAPNLLTPAGGSAMPASHDSVDGDLHSTRMTIGGQDIKAHAAFMLSAIARQVCDQQGITVDDIDWFVPHQANKAIMEALAEELGVPAHKMVSVIEHTGNIVSATLPYAFDAARRDGRLRPGDLVLMTTGGAGYSAGAALYRMPA